MAERLTKVIAILIALACLGFFGYWMVVDSLMQWSTLSPYEKGTIATMIGATLFSMIVAWVGYVDAFGQHKKQQSEEIPDFSREPPSLGDAKPGRVRRVEWL
jgi:TRAP-type C4-dicarboxylate transport system permease small subunit